MKNLFLQKTNKQNSGFSLVELVVAIGILAVISTIVAFMMTSSSKNYGRMSVETQLQSEAQLVANAISEYAIDSYTATNVSAVALDSEYDNTEDKILVLDSLARDGQLYNYVIARTAENKLYLGERVKPTDSDPYSDFEYSLLGNYISDFTVDTSHVEKDNIIDFKLTYTKSNRSYTGNYQVLMRNRAYADKEPDQEDNNNPIDIMVGLQPKQVYVDIIGGHAGQYYYINEVSAGGRRNFSTKTIDFAASVTANKSNVDKKVEWFLNGADANGFELPMAQEDADGNKTLSETAVLNLIDTCDFKTSAIDEFEVSVSKTVQVLDGDGNVVDSDSDSAKSKVHLRRVKSVNIEASSGYTNWETEFNDYGTAVTGIEDFSGVYAKPNVYGIYSPMMLFADLDENWVPYGEGLVWTIQMKNQNSSTTDWIDCDANFASLQYTTPRNDFYNTVKFGNNAKNGQVYRITVTTVFDNTVMDEFVIGVAPRERELGGGFNSRGFYVNLAEFTKEMGNDLPGLNYGGSQAVFNDFINGNFETVWKGPGGGGGGLENSGIKVEQINGEWYVYLDYASFQYTNSQIYDFYSSSGTVEIYLKTTPSNGTVTLYYWIAPVYVHKDSPSKNVFVIPRGGSESVKITTDYYNIIGEQYFGIYVRTDSPNDGKFGPNLIGSNSDLNPYLNIQVGSAYGDVKHYVDTMRVSMTAKQSVLYNPNPMTVRFTAEEYYKLCDTDAKRAGKTGVSPGVYNKTYATAPCTDITVYMANVVDQNIFIPCPATTASKNGQTMYPLSSVDGSTNKYDVKVYLADGTTASAKTYKVGSQYKCMYGGIEYTYNPTYYYWYK